MKIDLHCHTKATKSDEPVTRNVTVEMFKEKVEKSEVKMLAITNHNSFDKANYDLLKDAVKEFCCILPGIEFDVSGETGSCGHIIIIANPKKVDEFESKVNELVKDTLPDNFCINSHLLYDSFKSMDVFYIAHHMKDKSLSYEDLEDLENYMNHSRRLLKEAGNIVSIGILQCNNHRAIIGSDVQDWSKYEDSHFGELKFEITSFDNLLKLVDKDVQLIDDLINQNLDEKVVVYGKTETKEFPFEIPVYNDVNIIFGDKGSGKTEILDSLEQYYVSLGEKPIRFNGGSKDLWYNTLIKNDPNDFDISNAGLADAKKETFTNIKEYKDESPVTLKSYYKYFKDNSGNKRKKKMICLTISKYHTYSQEKFKKLYNNYEVTENYINSLETFIYKLNHEEEINSVKTLLNNLKKNIYDEYKKEWLNQNSMKLVDEFIDKMNNYVSENVGTPSMPTETGLYKFSKNRIELKKNCEEFLNTLNTTFRKDEYIGKLGQKGKVYLYKDYLFINDLNKTTIDYKTLNCNKTELSDIIDNISKIKKNIVSDKIPTFVSIIKTNATSKNVIDLNNFMSVKKDFGIDNERYKPSKGELAILSLQHDLLSKKENNIFLIDEPEVNLGSTYINEEIVPLLKDLGRAKKKVIIATHDANVAVRTRPSNSILKIVNNDTYQTYIGNMFSDILKSIDSDKILCWKIESIKYLEGGKDAFDERGDLYE